MSPGSCSALTPPRRWLLGVALALAAGVALAQQPPQQEVTIEVPAARPAGIAGDGTRLWVLDGEAGEVLELAPATGEVRGRFALNLLGAKGLAFDGALLWVADPEAKQLHAFAPATGERARTIPVEVPPEKGYQSVEALAWDGQHLWTAIAAGFSSSFNEIDPGTGRIERSLFADCDPRGLAVAGERLWSLCANGADHPPIVDERRIGGDETGFQRSRQLLRRVDGRAPSGLFFDGTFLWSLDAALHRAVRFPPRAVDQPTKPQ
jgi:streptogramin lyase